MFSIKFNGLCFIWPPCREARTAESVEYFDSLPVFTAIADRSGSWQAGPGSRETPPDRAPRHICTASTPEHVASLQCPGPLARVLLISQASAAQPHLWEASEPGQQTKKSRVRNKSNSPDTARTG